MTWFKHLVSIGAAVGLLSTGITANAVTITFASLTGGNGDVFTMTSESGFEVVSNTGVWREGHLFGNPVPSIFTAASDNSVASVDVRRSGGGLFTFGSADFSDASFGGTADYALAGLFGGAPIFSSMGDIPAGFGSPVSSPAMMSIDTLRITFTLNNESSANIDNIVVAAVPTGVIPEPATVVLMGLGLVGLGAVGRRRLVS